MSIRETSSVITIQKGKWSACMVPEVGMNMVSVQYDGREIMNVPESVEQLRNSPTRYGNPLQLPANRTAFGKFKFEGTEYDLGINEPTKHNQLHGSVRLASFTDIQSGEDWVSGTLENHGELFPFPFTIHVKASVDKNGCSEWIELKNTGDEPMPLAFGLHSVFSLKGYFKLPIDKAREVNENLIPTGKLLELNDEQKSYVDGTYEGGTLIDTFFTAAGHSTEVDGIRFSVSENFDSWIVWNADSRQGFVALEPQQGAPNCLNTGDGLIVLQPGQTEVFTTRFELAD